MLYDGHRRGKGKGVTSKAKVEKGCWVCVIFFARSNLVSTSSCKEGAPAWGFEAKPPKKKKIGGFCVCF
jgi:hypothetical protein